MTKKTKAQKERQAQEAERPEFLAIPTDLALAIHKFLHDNLPMGQVRHLVLGLEQLTPSQPLPVNVIQDKEEEVDEEGEE